jgi:hypothetical protein
MRYGDLNSYSMSMQQNLNFACLCNRILSAMYLSSLPSLISLFPSSLPKGTADDRRPSFSKPARMHVFVFVIDHRHGI